MILYYSKHGTKLSFILNELPKCDIGGPGKIHATISSKNAMKKRAPSYDCATENQRKAVIVQHNTVIAICASNYATALQEDFIKQWSKIEKKN